jgi:nucleotide-binding universal stress UspA family protein
MKTILVPIDFSSASSNAADFALDLAKSINASLVLLHVFEVPVLYPETAIVVGDEEEQMKEIRLRMEELKESLIRKSGSEISIQAQVKSGGVQSEIINYASTINAFVVVMGSGGKNSLERFFWGSRTVSITRKIDLPVIIVPPGAKFKKIEKVAFACDLENSYFYIPLTEIKEMVKWFNAELHILNISKDNKPGLSAGAREDLITLLEDLRELKPTFHYVQNKDVAVGIQKFADKMNIDLLIIVPKTYSLLKEIFHHSDSTAVLVNTHIPVMSIHD